jgi:hypothetical protein
MSTLRFTDGMTIDKSGDLRTIRERDGWCVVGQGHCIPVRNEQEGERIIRDLQPLRGT